MQIIYTDMGSRNPYGIGIIFKLIWRINVTKTGTTTPSQRGPGSISNEGVLHIL